MSQELHPKFVRRGRPELVLRAVRCLGAEFGATARQNKEPDLVSHLKDMRDEFRPMLVVMLDLNLQIHLQDMLN